jgi:drug/metabolite transporter (DMT)-like permease
MMPKRPSQLKLYLSLVLGIISVSCAAVLIRLVQIPPSQVPPLVIAVYRMGLAALILLPVTLTTRLKELNRLSLKQVLLSLLSGFFLGLHFALWITSLEYTSITRSVVLVTTSPIFVGIISHFILKERVSGRLAVGIVMTLGGGIVVSTSGYSTGKSSLWGDFLALAGAGMMALYLLLGRKLRQQLSLLTYIFLVYTTSALLLIFLSLLLNLPLRGYSSKTYFLFLLLALIPTIIGHSSFNWSLKYLPAPVVSVSILGEPVGASLLAYLFLKEVPTWMEVLGGGCILVGIYISLSKREPTTEGISL